VVQVKLGVSGMYGPRNDQPDRAAHQRAYGADLRIAVAGLYVNAEYVRVEEDEGAREGHLDRDLSVRERFWARGGYVQLAYALALDWGRCAG
jgi:hypothetical protein